MKLRFSNFEACKSTLIPASVLMGASFLIICDGIARVVVSPAELPVGVITAMCGGPFFLYLMHRKKKHALL
ncbi:MAG: iron chelate uptake ABC transporter family permease subunit [Candidatus Bathyarchaeia archaeon]